MTDPLDDLEGLSADERARLDAFARAFDRLDAGAYAQLTEIVAPADIEAAQATALDVLGAGRGGLRSARPWPPLSTPRPSPTLGGPRSPTPS